MHKTLLAFATGALALAGFAFASSAETRREAAPAGGEPVLLELFTSQGCSSCPPADRLASELARDPALVVISRPVTYWDRLGWKDTLAREDNTELQRAYARAGLAGQNGVYTPQLVIDGRFGAVGSGADEVTRGIARHGGKGGAAIRVRDLGAEGFAVGVAGVAQRPAELVLVAVGRRSVVDIARGENGGRAIEYVNVVRDERRLTGWRGGQANLVIAPAQLQVQGADAYALVLREGGGGRVLAAGWLGQ
ncbi:DUF1223 domain-containing protein [Erythrobacter dokdonensis]|uniref:DUF1223 domain-containing protein n=1 Tax=Erythrobacter dokdonensis DSW-74 TaxID=1300349 RepID=A0A1A7BF05_9SPHN|nr:DUF1223 domain-containing protein [Erythrobacter dokdonensis]OBV11123.1 DUF1223 domain-containing protein [Erythrobacter dokdonensis DSW-74]